MVHFITYFKQLRNVKLGPDRSKRIILLDILSTITFFIIHSFYPSPREVGERCL